MNTFPHFIIESYPELKGSQRIPCQSGLSGSVVSQAVGSAREWCVRKWPRPHPDLNRLRLIHAGLRAARDRCGPVVPELLMPVTGRTQAHANSAGVANDAFVQHDGHFWEVTSWLLGEPSYLRQPSDEKLAAAISAVAALHKCWSSSVGLIQPDVMVSPAFAQRYEFLNSVLRRREELHAAAATAPHSLGSLAMRTMHHIASRGLNLSAELRDCMAAPVECHFVLRDLWNEHVLFTEEHVSGIIDFGAARIDEPLCDLARLLASLEPYGQTEFDALATVDDEKSLLLGDVPKDALRKAARQRWQLAIATYEQECGPVDRRRLHILDMASTLLSATQWFLWLCVDKRKFDQPAAELTGRWAAFLDRMDRFSS